MADTSLVSAPVIGISGGNADSASVRAMMTQISGTGAVPIFLGNHANRSADADLGKIDALVVMGNNADIDPAKYNAAVDAHTSNENATPEGKARADYEFALLQKAMDAKMPVLGVCGGMQRINVLCGGTLHQHIPDLTGDNHHAQQDYKIAPFIPVQPVNIAQGTTLGNIAAEINIVFTPGYAPLPPGTIMENSMHHQAVATVGNNLRVAANAEDAMPDGSKLVEAIEADPKGKYGNQFLIGVQWHPEFCASPLAPRLAQHVTEAAKAFAQAQPRPHTWEQVQQENILSALPQEKPAAAATIKITTLEEAKALPASFLQRFLEERNTQPKGRSL